MFTSQAGTMIKPDNIARRYMNPALATAGLHRFRFHDLRHTFGSLLIQDGASLVYVKDQMGHSSIQVTVDIYGHLVPSANIACVDRLDGETSLHQSAPRTHQAREGLEQQSRQVIENNWLPPRDSNPDMLIQSSLRDCENKENRATPSVKCGKEEQNPHHTRTKERVITQETDPAFPPLRL